MAEEHFPFVGAEDGEDTTPAPPPQKTLSSRIPAFIGFMILVVIVMWGLVHLVSLSQPWLSSLFPHPTSNTTQSAMPSPRMSQVAVPKTGTVPRKNTGAYVGMSPDLSVHILAVGVIDPSTGLFVNRLPSLPSDTVAVQFDIANDGGAPTGAWYFNAQLPIAPAGYPYSSPVQEPLGPGDHVVNMLRFTRVASGGGIFNVIVDAEGLVDESNDTNNTATIVVPMSNYLYY